MSKQSSSAARVESLKKIPLFSKLSTRSLQRLAKVATHYEAPAGSVLIQPNVPGTGLIILEEGEAVVELPRKKLERSAGECFGELSLLTGRGHIARVRAKTDVRCLAISREHFSEMLEAEPKMAISMLQILADRLSDKG